MAKKRCPDENPDCKLYPHCFSSEHHIYWPRRAYKSGLDKKFRNHPDNRVMLCREKHDELHATTNPPAKPLASEMANWLRTQEG